ncbi:MAG: hypothetical protein CMJ32_12540 [Phycisphaerae bacterium]|nr:hypothetical protein [Phycisphaerae bacterium]
MGLAVKRIQVIRPETWGVAFPYACDPNDRLTHACDALRHQEYTCPFCEGLMTPVVPKETKIGAEIDADGGPICVRSISPHFRHHPNQSCLESKELEDKRQTEWDSAGETEKHALMKGQIALALKLYAKRLACGRESDPRWPNVRLTFVCSLRICANGVRPVIDFPVEFDDAKIERKIPGTNRIGDAVTLFKGQVTSVIEVCASHPVSREKRDELNAAGIPWFEVNAKHFDPRHPSDLKVTQSSKGPVFCHIHQKEQARFEARAPERVKARERARRRAGLLAHLRSLRPPLRLVSNFPSASPDRARSSGAQSGYVEQWHVITDREHQIWNCLPGGGHTLYKVSRLADAVQRKASHGSARHKKRK